MFSWMQKQKLQTNKQPNQKLFVICIHLFVCFTCPSLKCMYVPYTLYPYDNHIFPTYVFMSSHLYSYEKCSLLSMFVSLYPTKILRKKKNKNKNKRKMFSPKYVCIVVSYENPTKVYLSMFVSLYPTTNLMKKMFVCLILR